MTKQSKYFLQKYTFAFLLLFLLSFIPGKAQNVVFLCTSLTEEGNNYRLDVEVDGFTDVIAMQFSINWESDKLTFDSIGNLNTDLGSLTIGNFGFPGGGLPEGVVTVTWLDPLLEGQALNDGSVLFSVFLTSVGPDPGNVGIAEVPTAIEFIDVFNNIIPVEYSAPGCLAYNGAKGTGAVFLDENKNCLFDPGEAVFQNATVQVQHDLFEQFDVTREDGTYWLPLLNGENEVSVILPNPLFEACAPSYILNVDEDSIYTLNLPLQSLYECPWLEVDIATPFVRYCTDNTYTVSYCNKGTAPAEDAYIEVVVDPFFTVTGTTLPWSDVQGNVYRFDLGDLDPLDCGNFKIFVTLSCDAEPGQTHCMRASIYPDTVCIPPAPGYSGAFIEVEGNCETDSVRFLIRNTGSGATDQPLKYIIIEDQVILMIGEIDLEPGEEHPVVVEANGATYRLEVEQEEGYPLPSSPSSFVEGCAPNGVAFSTGVAGQFSMDDESANVAIDCRESITSWDPNDKNAAPLGFGVEHYIEANTSLEYLIRFQNTGNDTAFKVVLLDTLDTQTLDPASIQIGAASHPFSWDLDGDGILSFVFNDILLPDSTTNEPASHGFVQFRIAQQADNPPGTLIRNEAAIYFDFNPPVITNQTVHKIGVDFIDIIIDNISEPELVGSLKVLPNPIIDQAIFQWQGKPIEEGIFTLYSPRGELLRRQRVSDEQWVFEREGLPAGVYFFTLQEEGILMASGRLLIH